ncbi:hypothetical protein ABK249_22960 [Neorhizobium sp. Rsf11]|uniref:Uncharacterized protein n=1 Tax=Neorhizobium phenanthreniclasticum TaxID=3157917 RepID=A0ABV0M7C9_9HYPH
MTRMRIGIDYEGVSCVKITKGTLPPRTTLDSNRQAFLYNTKWEKNVRALALERAPYTSGGGVEPAGSSISSSNHYWYTVTGSVVTHVYKPSRYTSLDYLMPLVDVKPVSSSTLRYLEAQFVQSSFGYQQRGQRWELIRPSVYKDYRDISVAYGNVLVPYCWLFTNDYASEFNGRRFYSVVWNLPGDETELVDPPAVAPVPGQKTIQINASHCRAAKPGYDVRTATPSQLAFDSSNRPVKIVRAADIAVPSGASEYDLGMTLPVNTVIDLHLYKGGTIYYPLNPADTSFGVQYWLEGTKIKFSNGSDACRARFMVLAFDDTPPTAGSNKVFRQFVEGGQNVIQLLRPGSADPVAFADVVVDSRWPALQLLAEDYIPVTANGHQTYSVPIDGAGMFLFVKFRTVHGGAGNPAVNGSYAKAVRQPQVAFYSANGVSGFSVSGITGDSAYCTLTDSQVVFHTHRGAPVRAYFNDLQALDSNQVSYDYDGAPILGIRYYVFGLAQP